MSNEVDSVTWSSPSDAQTSFNWQTGTKEWEMTWGYWEFTSEPTVAIFEAGESEPVCFINKSTWDFLSKVWEEKLYEESEVQ